MSTPAPAFVSRCIRLLVPHHRVHGSCKGVMPHGFCVGRATGGHRCTVTNFRIRLAAPGHQRRFGATWASSTAGHLLSHPFAGAFMGNTGSKHSVRSLPDDIADSLTWHPVSLPADVQKNQEFRKHICIEVGCVCLAWGALQVPHCRPSVPDVMSYPQPHS